jgi:hypothetical protein
MTSKNKCNKDNRKDSDSESSNDSEYIKKRKHTHRKKNNKCDDNIETCESEKINNHKPEKEEEEEIFIKFEIKTTLKKGLNIIKIKFEKV